MIAGSSLILACSYPFRSIVCCWIARDCGTFFFLPENRTISSQKGGRNEKKRRGKKERETGEKKKD